jgi:hypothetical protein
VTRPLAGRRSDIKRGWILSLATCAVVVGGCGGSGPAASSKPASTPKRRIAGGQVDLSKLISPARSGWSGPRVLARVPEHQGILPFGIVTADSGDEIAACGQSAGPADCEQRSPAGSYAATAPRGDGFLVPAPLDAELDAGPVVTPGGAAVASSIVCGGLVGLQLDDIDGASGHVTKTTTVVSGFSPGEAAIASNRRGDLAVARVAVRSNDAGTSAVLSVVVRRQRPAPGSPVVVAKGASDGGFRVGIDAPSIAVEDDGSVLIAYEQTPKLLVVTLSPGGVLGRPQRLGALRSEPLALAVGAGGRRAFVVWGTQAVDQDGPMGQFKLRAAIRSTPDGRFGSTVLLDPGGSADDLPFGTPSLAVAADGSAVVEWDNFSRHTTRPGSSAGAPADAICAALAPAGAPFARRIRLAGNGTPGRPAIQDDGTAATTWLDTAGQVTVAVTQPGAIGLGRPEVVTDQTGMATRAPRIPSPTYPGPRPPSVAFGPPTAAFTADGHPLVAWPADFPGDPDEDLALIAVGVR